MDETYKRDSRKAQATLGLRVARDPAQNEGEKLVRYRELLHTLVRFRYMEPEEAAKIGETSQTFLNWANLEILL